MGAHVPCTCALLIWGALLRGATHTSHPMPAHAISASPSRTGRAIVPLLLDATVFLGYQPSLGNGYSYWDESLLFRGSEALSRFFPVEVYRAFADPVPDRAYYPVYRSSIALDICLWGQGPFGHHLNSVLLHALATVVVYFLGLRGIMAPPRPAIATRESAAPCSMPYAGGYQSADRRHQARRVGVATETPVRGPGT